MKKAEDLLTRLGVKNYTERHIRVINDFIANGETDCKKLLDQLGSWDKTDLATTEDWLKN